MAYVPVCDYDGHFWPKKKHLFYVAISRGGDFLRYRRRFCEFHVADVEEYLAEYELVWPLPADRVADRAMAKCLSCCEPVEQGGRQVFITGYPSQNERKDYWGNLHESHHLPEYLQDI